MSGNNVVYFSGETSLEINPDRIFDELRGKLDSVIVIGIGESGASEYYSSSGNAEFILFELEKLKHHLISGFE